MTLIQAGFQPISFAFIAAGIATQAKMQLARLTPTVINRPSWNNGDEEFKTGKLTTPITDKSYWEGRYALTELTLKKEDGQTLVVNDAIVSLSRSKNIVKTQLVGLDGTVKEYICNGDYEIDIIIGIVAVDSAGQIVDEYPSEGIETVREFLDEKKEVQVAGVFLNIFDISQIVVERFNLTQETHSNRQVISIKASSDEDYEIKSMEY